MRLPLLVATLVALALPLAAQTPPPPAPQSEEKTAALDSDLHALSRIASLSKDLEQNRQVMTAIIDSNIESLREKRADGSFRWANLQREEDGRVTEEKAVEKVSTEPVLQSATVSAANAFRLEVAVPRKRNLVSDNNRVFFRSASVDWSGADRKPQHSDIEVNAWIAPGDAHSVPLPDIAVSAKATAFLGVDSGNKKAVAKVSLIQAKLVDDPASPNFPAVTRLLNIRRLVTKDRIARAELKSAVDEAILALPQELQRRMAAQQAAAARMREAAVAGTTTGTISLGDATPDVVVELSAIARLSNGTAAEQAEGRDRLGKLIDRLSPPAPKQ